MAKFIIIASIIFFTFNCYASDWTCINKQIGFCNTWRMKVPQGWIVASDNSSTGSDEGYAMIFVPDQSHEWN